MDAVITTTAGTLGVPEDLVRIAFCIVASFPLCSLLKRIPPTKLALKETIITAVGLFYLVGVFRLHTGTLLLLACAMFTYLFAAVGARSPRMPYINFYLQMAVMFYTHCHEQSGDGDYVNNIGISGSQMILLQKLTSYAWDIHDGTRPEDQLSAAQKEARLRHPPSLLRFISWVFFFPTILTGPACTFAEYSNWLDMSMYRELRTVKGEPLQRAPRSGTVLLFKLLEGLMWVAIYTQVGYLSSDMEIYARPWYTSLSFGRRVAAVYVLGVAYRTKYYAAWLMSEAVCIHSGLSFNGVNPETGRLRWDRMRNVSPFTVETSQNAHSLFANWNIVTAKWLRNYVYLRVTPEGHTPGVKSTFVTFLTSAVWHGTRPGYYLTFITGAVYQTFGKVYRRNLRPVFLGSSKKWAYDVVCLVVTQLALSFAVMPFILLNLAPAFRMWATLYFYPYVGIALSWLLLLGPLKPFVIPKLRLLSRDLKKSE